MSFSPIQASALIMAATSVCWLASLMVAKMAPFASQAVTASACVAVSVDT